METELRVLIESIEDDCREKRFYLYNPRGADSVFFTKFHWLKILEAFPSAKDEIFDAVDLLALSHPTASVFHLMRIAEYGLRALAHERQVSLPNKPIEWAQWQTLIDKIDESVRSQWDKAAAGPERDAALDFYKGALGQFAGFKDKYRNAVSHARKRYDHFEAESALNHVHDFMDGLSRKIGEKTRRPISKWP